MRISVMNTVTAMEDPKDKLIWEVGDQEALLPTASTFQMVGLKDGGGGGGGDEKPPIHPLRMCSFVVAATLTIFTSSLVWS